MFYFPNLASGNILKSYLANSGDEMPAKIYMKFKRDTTRSDDYVDENGHGNWQYVNAHELELNIVELHLFSESPEDADGIEDSEDIVVMASSEYVIFSNGSSKNVVVTEKDGAKQATLLAGANIQRVSKVVMDAVDLTVWEDE